MLEIKKHRSSSSLKILLATLLLVLFALSQVYGQINSDEQENTVDFEIGTIASEEGQLPFWLHSNQWGIADRYSSNGYLRLATDRYFGQLGSMQIQGGMELIGRISDHSTAFLNEGYLQADWHFLRMVAGRKKERIGITDSTFTSGSMIQSSNTSPVTKIRVLTPQFVAIPGSDRQVFLKGYFSHGFMENSRYIRSPFLHQKQFHLRVFSEKFPVQLYGGILQSTLWAGTHPECGDLGDGLDDFWNVLSVQSSDAEDIEPSARNETIGSTVGIYDFAIKYDFYGVNGLIHRQFFLETGAGTKFRNPWDGLWGGSIEWDEKFQILNQISWEHLYTKRQSSQEHRGDPPYGADSYYNNGTYRSGWTYHGRSLGSALLFSDGIHPGVDNNIVIAHQLGLGGEIGELSYKLIGTYSRNYGASRLCTTESCNTQPSNFTERRDQYSFLLETRMDLTSDLDLNVNLAYDTGELYPDQFGGQVSIVYELGIKN